MPASYPGAVKTFTTKTDGVDDYLASHINDPQLEITAIETELGTDVAGPSTDLKTRLTKIDGDVEGADWTDYSATSTVVGWSSFSNKQIWYKKIGKLMFVMFNFNGTSNSATATFTLPYAAAGVNAIQLIWVADNGAVQANPGYASLGNGSSTVTLYKTTAAAAWTASGGKETYGMFFYRTSA